MLLWYLPFLILVAQFFLQKAKFTKRLFKQLDANELNIDNLQLDSELEDIDGDGVEERIIIIRQKEIIKQ